MDSSVASPDAPVTLDSMSASERAEWRLTGNLPERSATAESTDPSPDAASTPAEPAEQAVSTETRTPPASEPGKPARKNAETRIPELLAERKAAHDRAESLQRELDALKASLSQPKTDVAAASSPAPAAPTLEEFIGTPDVSRPRLSESEFYQRFPDATIADLSDYVSSYRLAKAQVQAQQSSVRERTVEGYKSSIAAAVEANPEFWQSIDARVASLTPIDRLAPGQPVTGYNVIAQGIMTSPVAASLLTHFSTAPADLDRLAALPSEAAILREMGRLEARFDTTAPATPKPVVKTTTSAPAPPQTLGSKPAVPADEMRAAVIAGDFARFRSVENAREAAR